MQIDRVFLKHVVKELKRPTKNKKLLIDQLEKIISEDESKAKNEGSKLSCGAAWSQ